MRLFSTFNKKGNQSNSEIQVGDPILLSKPNYTSVITIREIPETDEFELEKVFIEPGKYFKANQTILTVGSRIHGSGILFVPYPLEEVLKEFIWISRIESA